MFGKLVFKDHALYLLLQIMHKYSVEVERNVREWLQAQLGVVIDEYEWPYGGNGIHLYLKDGTILR